MKWVPRQVVSPGEPSFHSGQQTPGHVLSCIPVKILCWTEPSDLPHGRLHPERPRKLVGMNCQVISAR